MSGLRAPNGSVCVQSLRSSVMSDDESTRAASAQTYKTEFIDQVCDAPHGWRNGRSTETKAVLMSFGEEVRPKLDALAQSDDLTTRYDSISTLLQMTTEDELTPERIEFFKSVIRPLLNMTSNTHAATAEDWLEALEAGEPIPGVTVESGEEANNADTDDE